MYCYKIVLLYKQLYTIILLYANLLYIMIEYYKKLKAVRLELNLNQKEAAEASGLSQEVISRIENGKTANTPIKYLLFLAEKGADMNFLFNSNPKPIEFNNESYQVMVEALKLKIEALEDKNAALKEMLEVKNQEIFFLNEKIEKKPQN